MPDDANRCIRCGHDLAQSLLPAALIEGTPQSVAHSTYRGSHGIKWLRLIGAVFSSYLFFLVSCTSGMVASTLLTDYKDYGPEITQSRSPSKHVVVIASVPDAGAEGGRKPIIVALSRLDKFKEENPNYSFLLPPGKGQIVGAELTDFQVTPSGSGTIIVKVHFHHDVPPAGLDVRARYEATDKNIKLLNAKIGIDLAGALIDGFIFATILAGAGSLLKRRFGPKKPSVSPDSSSPSISRPKSGMLSTIIVVLVVVILAVAMRLSIA